MDDEFFTREDLSERGWSYGQERLILDTAEERGPCGYWMNPYGKPLYSKERVLLAEKLEGIGTDRDISVEIPETSEYPYRRPVKILCFHLISSGFSQYVISHPVLGPLPQVMDTRKERIESLMENLREKSDFDVVVAKTDLKIKRKWGEHCSLVCRPANLSAQSKRKFAQIDIDYLIFLDHLITNEKIDLQYVYGDTLAEIFARKSCIRIDII